MEEHQRIGGPRPAECQYSLREEVAGDHGVHMCAEEGGPRQGGLLFAPLRGRVDTCLVQDPFDGIGTGVEPQLFQLAHDALVATQKAFRPDADDDVAQLLRQARSPYRFEGTATTHLGAPALGGRVFGDRHEPFNLVTELICNAQSWSRFAAARCQHWFWQAKNSQHPTASG